MYDITNDDISKNIKIHIISNSNAANDYYYLSCIYHAPCAPYIQFDSNM